MAHGLVGVSLLDAPIGLLLRHLERNADVLFGLADLARPLPVSEQRALVFAVDVEAGTDGGGALPQGAGDGANSHPGRVQAPGLFQPVAHDCSPTARRRALVPLALV